MLIGRMSSNGDIDAMLLLMRNKIMWCMSFLFYFLHHELRLKSWLFFRLSLESGFLIKDDQLGYIFDNLTYKEKENKPTKLLTAKISVI